MTYSIGKPPPPPPPTSNPGYKHRLSYGERLFLATALACGGACVLMLIGLGVRALMLYPTPTLIVMTVFAGLFTAGWCIERLIPDHWW